MGEGWRSGGVDLGGLRSGGVDHGDVGPTTNLRERSRQWKFINGKPTMHLPGV